MYIYIYIIYILYILYIYPNIFQFKSQNSALPSLDPNFFGAVGLSDAPNLRKNHRGGQRNGPCRWAANFFFGCQLKNIGNSG